jgi:hypothetical protein
MNPFAYFLKVPFLEGRAPSVPSLQGGVGEGAVRKEL